MSLANPYESPTVQLDLVLWITPCNEVWSSSQNCIVLSKREAARGREGGKVEDGVGANIDWLVDVKKEAGKEEMLWGCLEKKRGNYR